MKLIGLNSMYWMKENNCGMNMGTQQLEWLDSYLTQSSPHDKFILSMHVFPGLNYYINWEQQFWHQNFTDRFTEIMSKHQDRI